MDLNYLFYVGFSRARELAIVTKHYETYTMRVLLMLVVLSVSYHGQN